MLPQQEGNSILNATLNPSDQSSVPTNGVSTEEVYDDEIANILSNSGVSVVPVRKPLTEILAQLEPPSAQTTMAQWYTFNPALSQDLTDAEAALSGSQELRYLSYGQD